MIWSHDLSVMRRRLYRCAVTAAQLMQIIINLSLPINLLGDLKDSQDLNESIPSLIKKNKSINCPYLSNSKVQILVQAALENFWLKAS